MISITVVELSVGYHRHIAQRNRPEKIKFYNLKFWTKLGNRYIVALPAAFLLFIYVLMVYLLE